VPLECNSIQLTDLPALISRQEAALPSPGEAEDVANVSKGEPRLPVDLHDANLGVLELEQRDLVGGGGSGGRCCGLGGAPALLPPGPIGANRAEVLGSFEVSSLAHNMC